MEQPDKAPGTPPGTPAATPQRTPPGTPPEKQGMREAIFAFVTKPSTLISVVGILIPLVGIVPILIYTGPNGAFGVAMLTALSSGAVGLLLGLLFGVPRQVSSGAIRQAGTSTADTSGTAQGNAIQQLTPNQARSQASRFATSTNLAEVSDWLTKLLLGAGLVSLTKIGAPLGHLIDTVAAGLTVATSPSSSAKLVAGAILFGYGAIGFLIGYLVTTLWYQSELEKVLVAQT
jgi:hypothetical protein